MVAAVFLFCPLWVSLFLWYRQPFDFRDSALEITVRTYSVLGSGFLLAALIAGLSFFIHIASTKLLRRYFSPAIFIARYSWLTKILVFFFLLSLVSHFWPVPDPVVFAAFSTLVFGLVFPLVNLERQTPFQWPIFIFSMTVALVLCFLVTGFRFFIEEALAGVVVDGDIHYWRNYVDDIGWIGLVFVGCWIGFVLMTWLLGRPHGQGFARRVTVFAGRLAVCFIAFPTLALGFLSGRSIPQSPQVSQLLDYPCLFDVQVDSHGGQLLVTQGIKYYKQERYSVGFSLPLDNLLSKPILFWLPIHDLEDVALDPIRRELYRLDERTLTIYVMDADSFVVKRTAKVEAEKCESGTRIDLVRRAGRLFVVCEEEAPGNLLVINQDTLQTEKAFTMGFGPNILSDEDKGLLYIKRDESDIVETLDAITLTIIHRAHGPTDAQLMAKSDRRQELYLPAPKTSEIWVYSIPDLRFICKIPTQFGARVPAVDEVHGLLFIASYMTGYLDVIDLATRKTVQHHYVGKYTRITAVDPSRRHAFINTTNEGLFLLKY